MTSDNVFHVWPSNLKKKEELTDEMNLMMALDEIERGARDISVNKKMTTEKLVKLGFSLNSIKAVRKIMLMSNDDRQSFDEDVELLRERCGIPRQVEMDLDD